MRNRPAFAGRVFFGLVSHGHAHRATNEGQAEEDQPLSHVFFWPVDASFSGPSAFVQSKMATLTNDLVKLPTMPCVGLNTPLQRNTLNQP